MADSKTAAEWQSVLNQANSQLAGARSEAQAAFTAALQANANVEVARAAVDREVAANGGRLPFFSSVYNDYKNAVAEADIKNAANETAQAKLANINATVNQAETSLATAQSSVPGVTNATPDPASVGPGNPDVVQVTAPVQKVTSNETSTVVEGVIVGGPINQGDIQTTTLPRSIDPAEDADTAAGLLRQEQTQNEIPDWDRAPNVLPEEDPFEASRLQAEQEYNNTIGKDQQTIDDGSDPYVSNGTTTVAPVFQDDGSDPYVSNGATTIPAGTASSVNAVRSQAVQSAQQNSNQQKDWRLKLTLAPNVQTLYNVSIQGDILYPLKNKGVIFPYLPTVTTNYRAHYDSTDLTHTNYKQYFYKNSAVDEIQIQAVFTAQDTTEALYMLSVIHFFKSVTKMYYGKDGTDGGPPAGTPPPLCFLTGLGQYQFNNHPVLVSNFSYTLPNEVDYIRAGSTTNWAGQNVGSFQSKPQSSGFLGGITDRLFNAGLNKGGISPGAAFATLSNSEATYVPTKLSMTITLLPIVTRKDIVDTFSVKDYATGKLLKGGIW